MVIVPFLIFSTIFGIHSGVILNWKRSEKEVLNWKRCGGTIMNWKRGGGKLEERWRSDYELKEIILKINCIMRECLLYDREINLIKYLK